MILLDYRFGHMVKQLVIAFVFLVPYYTTYLGVSSSYQTLVEEIKHLPERKRCSNLAFLAPRQQELCSLEEKIIDVIHDGASMGIDECQYQFQNRRWNCTVFNTTNVFGQILTLKSRETSYIYAILSAGIMYSVTRACAKGDLGHCGCDTKVRQMSTGGEFEWGGCSDNIRYGSKFSKDFVDSKELRYSADGLMNMWNNGAGRKTVKEELDLVCKCHGVSGSCSVKICWRKMKPFRAIGSSLKNRFDGASRVKMDRRRKRLKRTNKLQKRPTKKDLVYLQESPDFCEHDLESGSMGTRGRECNKTSYGLDGCKLMCCGRGYYTLIKEEKDDCDCKFYWCCRVECKKCTNIKELHYCN